MCGVSSVGVFHNGCFFSLEIDLVQCGYEFGTEQDPGTEPAKRVWTSLNVGTEIYVSSRGETAEWTVSDFDVLVPEDVDGNGSGFG